MIDQTTIPSTATESGASPEPPRAPIADWITPGQAAAMLRISRASVIKIMRAGQLVWTDARVPGSRLPRYRLDPQSVLRWPPPPSVEDGLPEPVRKVASIPRRAGVIARRIEARRARRARLGSAQGRTA